MTALKDYLTVTQAAAQIVVTPARVRVLIRDLAPPQRLDVHARLTLVHRSVADRLARERNRKRGRPVGWRKKRKSED
jgi:hypothetical protein